MGVCRVHRVSDGRRRPIFFINVAPLSSGRFWAAAEQPQRLSAPTYENAHIPLPSQRCRAKAVVGKWGMSKAVADSRRMSNSGLSNFDIML